jgi:plasmid stabilization system protein ParE
VKVARFVFRPKAAEDIAAARGWYEREREGLGDELLAEIRTTVQSVLAMPEAYPVILRQTRRALIHRFPYGLFYRIVDATVVFVACFHTSRNPALWKRRR